MEIWSAVSFHQVIAVKITDNKCEYILKDIAQIGVF